VSHFQREPRCACELCERAAILEFVAGMSRDEAERVAVEMKQRTDSRGAKR
jgi:hypothetical protein